MSLILEDPTLAAVLTGVGVSAVHEPLVSFIADGTADLDQIVAVATGSGRAGSQPGELAAQSIAAVTRNMRPSRFEPYLESEGVLGGFMPLARDVWMQCTLGLLIIRARQLLPDVACMALVGRPLASLVEHPCVVGRDYVIDDCSREEDLTVASCRVPVVAIEDALARARAGHAASAAIGPRPSSH